MNIRIRHIPLIAALSIPTLCLWQPLMGDELSELYLNSSENNSESEIAPNLLFIIDTSGSMAQRPDFFIDPVDFYDGVEYDSSVTYPGACDSNHLFRLSPTLENGELKVNEFGYPITSSGDKENFQSCSNTQFGFHKATFVCKAALDKLNGQEGWWYGGISEFRPKKLDANGDPYEINNGIEQTADKPGGVPMDGRWHGVSSHTANLNIYAGAYLYRDCPDDIGIHGAADGHIYKYPSHASSGLINGYGTTPNTSASDVVNSVSKHVLVSGNFLNWYNEEITQTRLAAVQIAIREIIRTLPAGTRIGLMRFDSETIYYSDKADGGMVIKEFVGADSTVDTNGNVSDGPNNSDFIATLFNIKPWEGAGTTLAESLLEGLYVFRGGLVHFGNESNIKKYPTNPSGEIDVPSVVESRLGPSGWGYYYYKSPIQFECQKNAAILLSDGDASDDTSAWGAPGNFKDLPKVLSDYAPTSCGDDCLDEIAAYLANEDQSNILGDQTVTTYTIGFGPEVSEDGQAYLQRAADAGGGTFTQATSFEELKDAFKVIARDELAANVSLSSPAVTVNAFNRLSHNNDVYFTIFDPAFNSLHWPGNLKKYQIKKINGDFRLVGADGDNILASNSSQIVHDAISFWTDPSDPEVAANNGRDGNVTTIGGAAGELTGTHMDRKLYSWFGNAANRNLTSPSNAFNQFNVSNQMVGLDASSTERAELIAWMSGTDTTQSNWSSDPKPRKAMGGSPHGVPAIVTYGGTEENPLQVIYVPTNDGFLHAIDASSGEELWAFIPTEVMPKFKDHFQAPADSYIGYGLDSSVIADIDDGGDGVIGSGEHAHLYFGMRRGGHALYALDVSDRLSPKLLWRIQGGDADGDGNADDEFHHLAQTWSQPQLARIRMGASDTDGKSVVIFGGGYDDTVQDSPAAGLGYVNDEAGNAVYIVDAETGSLLWSAGGSGSGAKLELPDMKSSIPADIELKDKDEDGFIDLMYAADLGGRIFRFDLDNTASQVVATGGMIASLGGGASAAIGDNRKFFAKPDAVLVARGNAAYWAINIGSGDRERPKTNMVTENWLFSIKDPYLTTAPTDYNYGIDFGDLYDVTSNAIQQGTESQQAAAAAALAAAPGWKYDLGKPGEKALAEAKTYDYVVHFTTFDPEPLDVGNCKADPGRAYLYSFDLLTAGAAQDNNGDGQIDAEDRFTPLTHNTIPPAVTFVFLEDENGVVEATSIIGRSDVRAPMKNKRNFRKSYWYRMDDGDLE